MGKDFMRQTSLFAFYSPIIGCREGAVKPQFSWFHVLPAMCRLRPL